MKRYSMHSSIVIRERRTYLELELPIAEQGRLAQYFKTLVAIFDTWLFLVSIQVRIGLDESGQPLNVGNYPFQSLFEAVLTRGTFSTQQHPLQRSSSLFHAAG